MFKKIIDIDFSTAKLYCYVSEMSPRYSITKRPAILIIPGGGYLMTCDREAEPVARFFMGFGYSAFVLRHSTAPLDNEYLPLAECSESMRIIRENADEWAIDRDNVAILGFSAGGHLAGSLATMYNDAGLYEKYGDFGGLNRPDAAILSYPVISAFDHPHRGSFENLLGEKDPSEEKLAKWSLENRVTEDTPPCFIWHTTGDGTVPVENSILFASALSSKKIPFELHIFPHGMHGISLVTEEVKRKEHPDPYIGRWARFSVDWLEKQWEAKGKKE